MYESEKVPEACFVKLSIINVILPLIVIVVNVKKKMEKFRNFTVYKKSFSDFYSLGIYGLKHFFSGNL